MNTREYYLGTSALDLPPPEAPKVPSGNGPKAIPSFLGSTKGKSISNSASNITNLSLSGHVRGEGTMNQTIKKLVLTSPDLSYAVETKIKTALAKHFTVYAKSPDGRVDVAGTEAAQALVMRFDLGSYDYTKFTKSFDIRTVCSSLLYDSFRYGGMGLELVLGKTRLPAYMKPFATRLISWADNTPDTYPVYKGPDGDVPLNYPNVFYSSTIQDLETPYADSPLQTAIQACLWDADFADDLRRAATKNLLQRLKVVINTDAYLKTIQLAAQVDEDKKTAHMNATVSTLEDQLAGLSTDDALVLFDMFSADTISDANRSEDRSITVLQALINGKISSGAKILPAIIGRGDSANAASTESMLFLNSVSSSQLELDKIISKALTLGVRLMGLDVYVVFELEEVNLRPGLELESFKQIKQARHAQLLSWGMQGDEITCIKLTRMLPPAGYKPLVGTGFYSTPADAKGENNYSNTSVDTTSGKTDSTQAQKDMDK